VDLSFSPAEEAFRAELRAWIAENLPPGWNAAERTEPESLAEEVAFLRDWQRTMHAGGWVGIHWPREYGGRGASLLQQLVYAEEMGRANAPAPINPIAIMMVGPTLMQWGTEEQKRRFIPTMLSAEEIWCQGYSEPNAGSDLAALQTRAVTDGDDYVVNGQKVWTSLAHRADWCILLCRTDPTARKHLGISYLLVDMHSPGITIRPLVQITGDAEFNEVFLDEVFVPDDQLVGALHNGWAVANTTLAHERGTAFPFKEQVVHEVYLDELWQLAAQRDELDDVDVADALAQSFVDLRVLRLHNWRTLSRLTKGIEPGPESSVTKLAWSDMTQALSARALDVVGSASPLWWGADDNPGLGFWQRQWLWSKAASIAGGTSEVQRTIIGERMLGLPR